MASRWQAVRDEVRRNAETNAVKASRDARGRTPGQQMLRYLVGHRRYVMSRLRLARAIRVVCSTARVDGLVGWVLCGMGAATGVVFGVCVVCVVHIDEPEAVLTPVGRMVLGAIVFGWIGCFLLLACVLGFERCVYDLETDPDEDPDGVSAVRV